MYLWFFYLSHILIKIYLTCMVKIGLKKIFANQFQTYLLPIFITLKFFKFHSYHKPNGGIDVFKMKHKKLSDLIFYIFVKKNYIFKWDFRQIYFLV